MTKTKSMIYCGLFTALIAAGAFIKIPVPVRSMIFFRRKRFWKHVK